MTADRKEILQARHGHEALLSWHKQRHAAPMVLVLDYSAAVRLSLQLHHHSKYATESLKPISRKTEHYSLLTRLSRSRFLNIAL